MISEGFVMKGGGGLKGTNSEKCLQAHQSVGIIHPLKKCTGMIKISCKYETQTKKNGNEMETKETLVGGGAEKFG